MTDETRDSLLIELTRWAISREPEEGARMRMVELLRRARTEVERPEEAR